MALIQIRLGDLTVPYRFTDTQLDQWINDAIAYYSLHFPRTNTTIISCSDEYRAYDLPANCTAILIVEYPTGQDPPQYLYQREYIHPGVWQSDGFYAFIPRNQDND